MKMKNLLLKVVTTIMLILNTVTVSLYMTGVVNGVACIIMWVISDLWLVAFLYANAFYVPGRRKKHVELRDIGICVGVIMILYFSYRGIMVDNSPYGGIDLLLMIMGVILIGGCVEGEV
jgi:hypothetical protein